MSQGDTLWTFCFTLAAWRINDGDINEIDLIARRLATKKEFDALHARVKANTVIKFKGRVAMENVWNRPESLLEELIGEVNTDSELNECLEKLLEPVVYSDELFGDLTLDRTVNNYLGKVKWNGSNVDLWLRLDEPNELSTAIRNARDLWAHSDSWNQRVLDCIARDVLPLKSENWQEDDGSTVSREAFEARIKLNFITVGADGSIEFWYDDGDLFFGHDIAAEGTLSDGVRSAGIHG
jgi:hypothetical protein